MSAFALDVVLSLPLIGAYALLGLGITVIYRASRVLNLAHGALAMGSAYATYQLWRWGVPIAAALLGGLVFGAAFGVGVERVFVRRLRAGGATTQTVGTVAALGLSIAVAARIYGTLPVSMPLTAPQGAVHLLGGFVPYTKLAIFPVAVLGAAGLFALLEFTDLGLAMRGAAQNRRGAALRGVNPDATAMFAWVIGGAFAALAGILLAGAGTLDPYTISLGTLPAFVAALIGGLESMPGVLIGSAVIGLVQGVVPALATLPVVGGLFAGVGAPELVLGVVALVVMAAQGQRLVAGDVRGDSL